MQINTTNSPSRRLQPVGTRSAEPKFLNPAILGQTQQRDYSLSQAFVISGHIGLINAFSHPSKGGANALECVKTDLGSKKIGKLASKNNRTLGFILVSPHQMLPMRRYDLNRNPIRFAIFVRNVRHAGATPQDRGPVFQKASSATLRRKLRPLPSAGPSL